MKVLRDVSVDGSHSLEAQVGDPATVRSLRLTRAMGQCHHTFPENLCQMHALEKLEVHAMWGEQCTLPQCLAMLPRLREVFFEGPGWETLPEVIGRIQGLCSLVIREGALRNVPAQLRRLKRLERLELSGALDAPECLLVLRPLALKTLTIRDARVIDLELLPIGPLEQLDLDSDEIRGWRALEEGRGLQNMTLSTPPLCSPQTLWPGLRDLTIWGAERDQALAALATSPWPLSPQQCPALERLALGSCDCIDLAPVRHMSGLRHLLLEEVSQLLNHEALGALHELRHLGISGNFANRDVEFNLSTCVSLDSLELRGCSRAALERHAREVPSLTRLYIDLSDLSEEEEDWLLNQNLAVKEGWEIPDFIDTLHRLGVKINDYSSPDPWSEYR